MLPLMPVIQKLGRSTSSGEVEAQEESQGSQGDAGIQYIVAAMIEGISCVEEPMLIDKYMLDI